MQASLDLYKVFYTVAKSGSLTAAAKELYVSQPAVSQSIRQLENQLGGRLFVRTARGIELTPEGNAMMERISRAMGLIDEAEHTFAQMKQLMAGRVRMGAADTLCRFLLLDTIQQFHQQYPDVIIQVTNRTTRDTLQLLRLGKVDVGLINLPLDERDIEVTPVYQLNDCFVGSAALYGDLPKQTPQMLSQLPLMMLETISNSRSYVDRFFLDHGVSLSPQIELASLDLLRDFASIGMGVACIPRQFCQKELKDGTLVELPLMHAIPPRAIGLIHLKGMPLSYAAQRFLHQLLQLANQM